MKGREQQTPKQVRIDKKRDVKPTVPLSLAETVRRLASITNTPEWRVIEMVCINGFNQKKVISYLSQNFRRTVRISNTLYFGDINRVPVNKRLSTGKTNRLSTRFKSNTHEDLVVLAYALDCSVSRACALLLDAGVRDWDFINEFVKSYMEENLDGESVRELKKILRYINTDNPYNEEYSWAGLLSYIIDEVKMGAGKIQETVSEFITHHWKD